MFDLKHFNGNMMYMGESGQSGTMSRPQDFLEYLYTKGFSKGIFCATSMH